MKKYVKPVLHYENFELAQAITGTCDIIMNLDDGGCQGKNEMGGINDFVLFEQIGVCDKPTDIYCYTNFDTSMFPPFVS